MQGQGGNTRASTATWTYCTACSTQQRGRLDTKCRWAVGMHAMHRDEHKKSPLKAASLGYGADTKTA